MEIISFIFFIFGLFIGSFLNVLADRLPRNEDSIKGHSYCEYCKHQLSPLDLLPVVSFAFLKGKCRYCHKNLSWYYPFSELLSAMLYVATYVSIGTADMSQFLFVLFVVSGLIVIFSADLKHGIIPDAIVYTLSIITFLYYGYSLNVGILPHLISGVLAGLFFLVLFLFTKGKGMGFGDVKFSAFMGLLLGFPGVVYALYIAFLTGGVVSFILILWKKKNLKNTIAFGPFLVFGTIMVLLFPEFIQKIAHMVLPSLN